MGVPYFLDYILSYTLRLGYICTCVSGDTAQNASYLYDCINYCSDMLNAYVAICAQCFGHRVSPWKFGAKKECLQLLQLLSLHNTTHICFIGRRLFCVSALILLCFKMDSNANSRCFFSGDFIQADMN